MRVAWDAAVRVAMVSTWVLFFQCCDLPYYYIEYCTCWGQFRLCLHLWLFPLCSQFTHTWSVHVTHNMHTQNKQQFNGSQLQQITAKVTGVVLRTHHIRESANLSVTVLKKKKKITIFVWRPQKVLWRVPFCFFNLLRESGTRSEKGDNRWKSRCPPVRCMQ